jgi:hypothetical protein
MTIHNLPLNCVTCGVRLIEGNNWIRGPLVACDPCRKRAVDNLDRMIKENNRPLRKGASKKSRKVK